MLKIYSIHDSASEGHERPFVLRAHGEAMRLFQRMVQDPDHPIGQSPQHFTLFYHGWFDDMTGVLEGETKVALANGVDFVPSQPVELVKEGTNDGS